MLLVAGGGHGKSTALDDALPDEAAGARVGLAFGGVALGDSLTTEEGLSPEAAAALLHGLACAMLAPRRARVRDKPRAR